jgi:hypothetical protein
LVIILGAAWKKANKAVEGEETQGLVGGNRRQWHPGGEVGQVGQTVDEMYGELLK